MEIPQPTPIKTKVIRSITRPQDVRAKKERIDAYIRQIREEPGPDDDRLISTGVTDLPNGHVAQLVDGIDIHIKYKEKSEATKLALYCLIGIGGCLFLLIVVCICIAPKASKELLEI